MTEKEARQLVKNAGIRLIEENLVQGTWGNISLRLDEERMLVTPSGLDYIRMSLDDLVVVNMRTMEYSSAVKPTSEKKVHALVLLSRPDVNAVIHSHPRNCSAFAAARCDLPVLSDYARSILGDKVKVSQYGLPCTGKFTQSTVTALGGDNACIMANHGALACAADLDGAFEIMRVLEASAKEYIEKRVKELAEKNSYSREDLFSYFINTYSKNL